MARPLERRVGTGRRGNHFIDGSDGGGISQRRCGERTGDEAEGVGSWAAPGLGEERFALGRGLLQGEAGDAVSLHVEPSGSDKPCAARADLGEKVVA